jgi:chorismate synthase
MSIGAVKAVEIGDGVNVSSTTGSENNDCFHINNGSIEKITNHSGGTLGGMSDGSRLILRASFKPTPSIFQEQLTVNSSKEEISMAIKGRHDPIIGPRAVVVVESMTALTILDLMMVGMSSRLDNIKKIYNS